MNKLKEYKEIILNLIKLSLPILGGNISQILISPLDDFNSSPPQQKTNLSVLW